MAKRRRKTGRLGEAAHAQFQRQAMAAVEAAVQARRTTRCKSARRILDEAQAYYGAAVLDAATTSHLTPVMRQALAYAQRELIKTRDRLERKCGASPEIDED